MKWIPLYLYVSNSPVGASDPTGMWFVDSGPAAEAEIGANNSPSDGGIGLGDLLSGAGATDSHTSILSSAFADDQHFDYEKCRASGGADALHCPSPEVVTVTTAKPGEASANEKTFTYTHVGGWLLDEAVKKGGELGLKKLLQHAGKGWARALYLPALAINGVKTAWALAKIPFSKKNHHKWKSAGKAVVRGAVNEGVDYLEGTATNTITAFVAGPTLITSIWVAPETLGTSLVAEGAVLTGGETAVGIGISIADTAFLGEDRKKLMDKWGISDDD